MANKRPAEPGAEVAKSCREGEREIRGRDLKGGCLGRGEGKKMKREKESVSLLNAAGIVLGFCTEKSSDVSFPQPGEEAAESPEPKPDQNTTPKRISAEGGRLEAITKQEAAGGGGGYHFQNGRTNYGKRAATALPAPGAERSGGSSAVAPGGPPRLRLGPGRPLTLPPRPVAAPQEPAVPPRRRSSLRPGAGGRGINPPVRVGAITRS